MTAINPQTVFLAIIVLQFALIMIFPQGKQVELLAKAGSNLVKMLAGLGLLQVLQLAGVLAILQ